MSRKDWMPVTVHNSGARDEGAYKTIANGKQSPEYGVWGSMVKRCYSPEHQEKFPTYKGCSVCIDWHGFQTFAQWYEENYPLMIENGRLVPKLDDSSQRWELDKDILVPGNKIYSPETCCFMTRRLNNLFTDKGASRGDMPLGICLNGKSGGKCFIAGCSDGNGRQIQKRFHCLNDAVDWYWAFKFKVVLSACEEVSDYDEELGELVMNYFTYFKNKHSPK